MMLFIVSTNCATKPHVSKIDISKETHPKIIFLNYNLSEAENGKKTATFINQKTVEGRLRNSSSKYIAQGHIGDLVCSQFDKNKALITKQAIENPLLKTIEYTYDSLALEKKTIKTKKTPFSLRLQLSNATKTIELSEIIDSLQNTKSLIITKIN
ncbi:hypothetical protein ACFFU1_04220 [Algibacter miyuki]|uniref:Lipoprotein n=1 Tax=Algibacter miyuki TaxID=1306933 RepID=A0ABV5GWS3_9FLAO|nr:hypothetical protein [Algibacter miyuki]MDN3664333.1 hypothetical protein [Algibacter miyuki]